MKHTVLAVAIATLAAHAHAAPPPNPFLSAPVYGITHFDSAQSDTHPYAVAPGVAHVDLSKQPRIAGGPINIMNLASTVPGFMWAVSTERITYVDARDGAWKAVAQLALPGAKTFDAAALDALLGPRYESEAQVEALAKAAIGPVPAAVMTNGLYNVADRDNIVYLNAGTVILAIGLKDAANPAAGLEVKRQLDAKSVFEPTEIVPGSGAAVRLIGMAMTYDGHLVLGSTHAIAVVDREFKKRPVIHTLPPGQVISNSFSVGPDNGIYVASGSLQPKGDGLLSKVKWTGTSLSTREADGGWTAPYEGGNWPPAIKFGTGTGSTPSLMGFEDGNDKLVVLTDGRDRMRVVAFWRDSIPEGFEQRPGTRSRRIAGQIEITAGLPADTPWIQSEQSTVVNGWGAFVVNNIPAKGGHADKFVDVLLSGPVMSPPLGMERVEWDPAKDEWRSVWSRSDVVSTSMVPVASSASNMVFVNGYTAEDGWEVTGMDWATGRTVYRRIFGHGNLGNGAYAILQHLPDGDLLFNSIGGPLRIE